MRYLCELRDRPAPWVCCDSASFENGRSATREYHAFVPIGAAEGTGPAVLRAAFATAELATPVLSGPTVMLSSAGRCVPRQAHGTDTVYPEYQALTQPWAGVGVSRLVPELGLPQRLREEKVTYTDRTLTCVDCGAVFVHSAEDQEYYATKGFVSDPKRCPSCRAARRSMRETGEGTPRSASAGPREYFAAVCSRCGNQAQVPFKPHMDRPVYCSDCFRVVHAQGA